MDLIDIGLNLTSSAFKEDQTRVLERAHQAGIKRFVLIGSNIEDSNQALELAKEHPACIATAGIHPHNASEFDEHSLRQLTRLQSHSETVAMGEMGLDYNRNYSPQVDQKNAFEAQLDLAAKLNMPVYLHQRDAAKDFYQILTAYRDKLPRGVVHCFTGDQEELNICLDMDLYIGITGWICDDRRGKHLHSLVKQIPADRLMIETDSPYLLPRTITPKPSNRRNEPAYLPWVLTELASATGKPERQLAIETTANAEAFFGL